MLHLIYVVHHCDCVRKQISRSWSSYSRIGRFVCAHNRNDEPHKLNAAFNLNRFVSGDLVDEHGAAAVAH